MKEGTIVPEGSSKYHEGMGMGEMEGGSRMESEPGSKGGTRVRYRVYEMKGGKYYVAQSKSLL